MYKLIVIYWDGSEYEIKTKFESIDQIKRIMKDEKNSYRIVDLNDNLIEEVKL